MAPSTQGKKPERTAARRSELRQRIVFGASAGLLILGAVVFMQARTDKGPAPTPDNPTRTTAQAAPLDENNQKLDREVRRVAGRFLITALGRENPAESWSLAAPELRNVVTKQQWFRGEMPIPPFPMDGRTGLQVVGQSPNEVLLQVFIVPPANNPDYKKPIRYDMTLVKRKGHWLVSYLLPYDPPPIRDGDMG